MRFMSKMLHVRDSHQLWSISIDWAMKRLKTTSIPYKIFDFWRTVLQERIQQERSCGEDRKENVLFNLANNTLMHFVGAQQYYF
jgi:hypothetical protein